MRKPHFVLLSFLCIFAAAAGLNDREPAPRFFAKTMDGEKFSNDSVKGKVVLLQFWATWCQYCRREQPIVDDIDHEFAAKGLVVLAVDVGESKKKVKQYLASTPRTCKVVLTEDNESGGDVCRDRVPRLCRDRQGRIHRGNAARRRG